VRRLLRWLARRAPTPVDFRAIPLPPTEHDDGNELVIVRPDGTRLHLPSRATRDATPEPPPQPPRRPLTHSQILLAAARRSRPSWHDGTRTP